MATRTCALCGKKIMLSGNNYIVTDDSKIIHKHCPKEPKSAVEEQESRELVALRDKIKYYLDTCPLGYLAESPRINWVKCNNQIKDLCEQGYSYEEQLYALNSIVKSMNGFFGYTAVVNRIENVISAKRARQKELVEVEVQEKPSFDLSKLLNQREEW